MEYVALKDDALGWLASFSASGLDTPSALGKGEKVGTLIAGALARSAL